MSQPCPVELQLPLKCARLKIGARQRERILRIINAGRGVLAIAANG